VIKKLLFLFLISFFLFGFFSPSLAQEQELMEGEIVEVLAQKEEFGQFYQEVSVLVKDGRFADQKITVETGFYDPLTSQKFKVGDRVVLALSVDEGGNNVFYIADYIRRPSLIVLLVIFVFLVIAVGGIKGFSSLIGLVLSFLVVGFLILPAINQGKDPVLVSVLSSVLMAPLLFYSAHGFNRKTTIAIVSTIIALSLTGILAQVFVSWANISGFSSEEMGFLSFSRQGVFNPRGLVLAGIIIGVLGVLDDVTVSQSAIVEKLKKVDPKIGAKRLFAESLSVGRDHIASMVNTLVLVYTGASLPLLLLFINSAQKFSLIINYEIIAEEIVRILVGSIGLVLVVPIATFLAVVYFSKAKSS